MPLPTPRAAAPFPRGVLWAVGSLLLFALTVAVIGRLTGASEVPAHGVPIVVRHVTFADAPDGDVLVTDTDTHVLVATVTGQAGFLRGTMRGLASFRKLAGKGPETPFTLTAWKDGRITLDDPATGRHIELEAFGPTNESAFAVLLKPEEPAP